MAEWADGRRARLVMHGFERFLDTQGFGDEKVSHALVEAYCAMGLGERTSATKGTYRSVLRTRAGVVLLPGRPRHRGSPAKAPYSAAERAELLVIARLQPKRWRGEAAVALVAMGMGAGLRAGEILEARGDDVRRIGATVVIGVGGDRARRVVVEEPFGAIAADLAHERGAAHLFRPGDATRHYHNFVNELCRSLVADPGAVRLSLSRCRSSYICDRLAAGVALDRILEATGICEVESLLRYAVFVDGAPKTKAQLRGVLHDQRCR